MKCRQPTPEAACTAPRLPTAAETVADLLAPFPPGGWISADDLWKYFHLSRGILRDLAREGEIELENRNGGRGIRLRVPRDSFARFMFRRIKENECAAKMKRRAKAQREKAAGKPFVKASPP